MPIPRIENLTSRSAGRPRNTRLWREWCFLCVAARHFRWRLLVLVSILVGGGLLFLQFEPEQRHSLPEAIYYTWCLIFGEPPERFPESWVLETLFFIVPILGLTVIIEGLIDLSMMIRDRRRCERSWCMMLAKSLSDHIVLVGFGRLGLRTYHMLRRLGEDVVVIERDPANQFIEEVRRDGAPLLIGNARHEALLEDANIARARSIILATNDDLANLETALDARRLAPQIRVVLRMFDQNMADKISAGFNIHLAMSQSAISAPAFATAAIDATMISSFIVEDQLVVMQRWQVRPHGPLAGQTVGDVTRRYGVSVVEQQQQEEGRGALFPPPETVLEAGQKLVVQGTFDTLAELRRQSSELT